jgi:hypothetical protein
LHVQSKSYMPLSWTANEVMNLIKFHPHSNAEKVQQVRGEVQASQSLLEHALTESLIRATSVGNSENTNVFGEYFFVDDMRRDTKNVVTIQIPLQSQITSGITS